MSALYLHIPFCRRKCPYCDFYSVPARAEALRAYPDLLLRHLDIAVGKGAWNRPLATVFFGGGTPSLLPPRDVGRILEKIEILCGLEPGAEITLEANPGTVSFHTLKEYREAGVNRLSLGIQSLGDDNLQLLGRLHTAAEAVSSADVARRSGFDNLAFDLMFGLPGQTVGALRRELDRMLKMEPAHLSCYGLTVEAETPFHHLHRRGDLTLPDEEVFADHFLFIHDHLAEAGFDHYEISNYARQGMECRHNMNYWRRGPYLGIGAGAHSFFSRFWGERWEVPGDLETFRQQIEAGRDPARRLERLTRRQAMGEALFLGLRCREGVAEADFLRRFGSGVAEAFPDAVARAGSRLRLVEGRWRLDIEGWLIFNFLLTPFLGEEMEPRTGEGP